MYILYNVCAMILTFVRLGVIFFTSFRQECHVKIKAKCHNFLVKVSQMTEYPSLKTTGVLYEVYTSTVQV